MRPLRGYHHHCGVGGTGDRRAAPGASAAPRAVTAFRNRNRMAPFPILAASSSPLIRVARQLTVAALLP